VTKGLVKSLSKKKILSKVNLYINVENSTVTSIRSKRSPFDILFFKEILEIKFTGEVTKLKD
jgi:hypothetical protein